MQSQGLARWIDWVGGLCLPAALFFFVVALLTSTELPRLKELDGELRVARGRLIGTEVRFISKRGSPERGFWCAFGKFVIEEAEAPLTPGGVAEGYISRVGPGEINGRSYPSYSQEQAEADAQKWTIGGDYQGWIYFDQPHYILFARPYEQLQSQVAYFCAIGGGLLGLFVLWVIVKKRRAPRPDDHHDQTPRQ